MSKRNTNESEMIKHYLKKLDNCKFLTKKEEQVIGRRIKKIEKTILKTCLKSDIFIEELSIVCQSVIRNANNVVKYSKNLIDASPTEDKARLVKNFEEIKTIIDRGRNEKGDALLLSKLIGYINLTSSALTQLIAPLKDRLKTVETHVEQSQNIYKFLEVGSTEEYDELVFKCQKEDFRKMLAKKLFSTNITLIKKIRQQEEILKFYDSKGLDQDRIEKLNILIVAVNKLEAKYMADRETLIHANLPLVVSRAKRFNNGEMNLEDLIQEGNIGLIKAIDKYDPDKNVKVTTYATWWIDQAIRRSISNKSKLVRVPTHVQQNLKLINQAFFILSQKLGREPNLKEISKFTEIPLKVIEDLNMTALHEVSIDSEISQGISYSDLLFDKNQATTFNKTHRSMLRSKIRLAISDLTPRSQKIIMLRFGIGTIREHTLEEIGTKLSLSKQRIRMIESEVFDKLKKKKKIPEKVE